MLADTHCHLDFNRFEADRDQVIENARETGVLRILNPGINLESSRIAVELTEKYPEVYAAVGVHPNEGSAWDDGLIKQLRELASHPKVVAIGEIGLDYYRDRTPRDIQQKIFINQLKLAAELELPVIIHSRESMEDIIRLLTTWRKQLSESRSALLNRPGVLHSFSGSEHIAQQALEQKFLIGITGPVTFHNAENLQDLVKRLPLNSLMVETDSPFLTPHPMRGKRNEPSNVKLVAKKITELRQASYNTVTGTTFSNAAQLFQW